MGAAKGGLSTTIKILIGTGSFVVIAFIAALIFYLVRPLLVEKINNSCYRNAHKEEFAKDEGTVKSSTPSDVSNSDPNVSNIIFPNILLSSLKQNEDLVGKIENILRKISKDARLIPKDASGIDINKINSSVIKLRSKFDVFSTEDLAEATRDLIETLQGGHITEEYIKLETYRFKEKAGIDKLVLSEAPMGLSSYH